MNLRKEYPQVPTKVEYALPELGESMRQIIKSMELWGLDYKSGTSVKRCLGHPEI